jgi:hypothetical protein
MATKTDTCENNTFKNGIEDALKANLTKADFERAYFMGGVRLTLERRAESREGLRLLLDRRTKLREANF